MRKFFLFLFICALVLGGLVIWGPGRGIIIEGRKLAHKVERRLRYELDLPLRGTPNLAALKKRLQERGLTMGAPIFIRIFKQESELELWLKRGAEFVLFETYPICRWSGELGPKLKQGDRQAPEGFYTVSKGQLNPNSRWHRSFNLGYPNIYDRAHGRTGDYLMVHGGCASIGCYAMTNPVIDELWQFVTAALKKSQSRFHVHVFPFRMNKLNMALYSQNPWMDFWRSLKNGHDLFDETRLPPRVSVCNKRYSIAPAAANSKGAHRVRRHCSALRSAAR